MTHAPSRILAQLLADLGQGSVPAIPIVAAWPVYTDGEPSSPDNCLTVKDTDGQSDGRSMIDGELFYHYGFQVRIRSVDSPVGWLKADAIRTALAQGVSQSRVTVDSSTYVVHCIAHIGSVLPLGKDTPKTKRSLFTLNALIAVRQVT